MQLLGKLITTPVQLFTEFYEGIQSVVIDKGLQHSGGNFWLPLFKSTKKLPLCGVSSMSNGCTS